MGYEQVVGDHVLLAFEGTALDQAVRERLLAWRPAGVTLFRHLNIESPAQVRALTDAIQQVAREVGGAPFLIAADQEGGQLAAIGEGVTALPGNMALGATGSDDLAFRAGEVIGRELAALGVNVNYAPVCDVNSNPHNPVIGVRSFGEDPHEVARLAAAMIRGMQRQGVAATAKHFPGHGDTAEDSHRKAPVVPHGRDRLARMEWVPFAAAIEAGVRLVMTAHVAVPSITGQETLPATLSSAVIEGVLRRELGFEGVVVSDALDMHAIRQGEGLILDSLAAVLAGNNLLLLGPQVDDQARVVRALQQALERGLWPSAQARAGTHPVRQLRRWVAEQAPQPTLDVLACEAHRRVAQEIAERSITLVRDENHVLPLRPSASARIGVFVPQPVDLTPADTSSTVRLQLGRALRRFHPLVCEYIFPPDPGEDEIASLVEQARIFDYVIVATQNAWQQPAQADLVRALVAAGVQPIVVALRLPYDLTAFPQVRTFVCTYSLQPPSIEALAKALFGEIPFSGRLPVSLPGLFPRGHGLHTTRHLTVIPASKPHEGKSADMSS
ncbi:beta-N-acetylhexosaminidase [Ardenticatena maritima]|uniref:beta-N-acetylhexosaminidase n=1 Tax=Ardenticatena maritima TaxID=872965 RepID=A0A0M8K9F2_9CHLR|nr:beta-N-acetylhexosaminidase [Ardenticatena maritima]GAP62996.1 beta-N-acetylhexosaminidase [Ardenticatena maritima]